MNLSVLLFFLQNVTVTTLLGFKFLNSKDQVFKNFGIALLLDSVAFAVWSAAVMLRPENLDQYVTVGASFFIASLVFLFITTIQKMDTGTRGVLTILGIIIAVALFYTRTVLYPSSPYFSPEGLFFFNLQPIVQMIYIMGLGLVAFPAIEIVAAKFKGVHASIVRYCFTIEVIGGVILMVSSDSAMLYVLGWIMIFSYILLSATLLFSKKAWSVSK